jgi:chromosomal replication initiator protein
MGTGVGELSTGVDNLLAAAARGWGMDQVWEQVLGLVEERVGKTTTETWLKPIRPLTLRDETVHLEVPSTLFRDRLLSNFITPLKESLASVLGYPVQVIIHIGSKPQGELFPTNEEAGRTDPSRSTRKGGLVSNYTFSTFVVGASNQFAHAAARAVADHPGKHYNPLFIYGGVGLGKTHLVNAIGHESLVRQGRGSIFYLSSESFTNQLIAHLRSDRMDDFKNKFRQADVLILDDVQFLSGRERTQEEFFHTFNSLYDAHKQIVLTSDKFPNEISGLEERLRNRFEWGLIADIQPPDLETRVAILQKKALAKKIPLPSEVAIFIASHVSSNVRELEGSLTRLEAVAVLTRNVITVDFARQVLQNLLKEKNKEISVETVQKAVCKYFGIRVADLTSKRRTNLVTFPRQVAMFLCRKLAGASYPMIGMRFGGKDHTTVLYACSAIEKRLKKDEELRAILDRIERTLYGHCS